MVSVFEGQQFRAFYDRNSAAVYTGFEFRNCKFISSAISITTEVGLRSTYRELKLKKCEIVGCSVGAALLDEIYVEGLKTNQLFQTWGSVFRHVTLKGKIGRIMISQAVAPGRATPAQQRAFDDANQQHYTVIDWALDISDAECQELEIQGVPSKLVRRDSETQIIVTRESAMRGDLRSLDLSGIWWPVSLKLFLDRGDKDVVLVAGKRHKNFKRLIQGLKLLREEGIAQPG
jgi:hypothetical protein